MLVGRGAETATIRRLFGPARAGSSGALVVRGEAGLGKSALSPCSRKPPKNNRCCTWSTMPSGSIRRRWTCSCSWHGDSTPSRSRSSSLPGTTRRDLSKHPMSQSFGPRCSTLETHELSSQSACRQMSRPPSL